MTWFLRADAIVTCTHQLGLVGLVPSQTWVRVDGRPLLVDDDPEGRPIAGCPNLTVTTKPCTRTLRARAGYSDLARIDGAAVVQDVLSGLTDGQGGAFRYEVRLPGQDLVREALDG